jgi:hypothetical protein
MKRLTYLFFGIVLFTSIVSCKKETLGVSKITYYPEVSVKGNTYMSIMVDGEYIEEGALALIDGEEVEYETIGSVDPSTPGLYQIDYSAVNVDGFSQSATRYIAVTNCPDDVDISGTYNRNISGTLYPNVVTKLSRGFFLAGNLLGNAGYTKGFYIMNSETDMTLPLQNNPAFGEIEGANLVYVPGVRFEYSIPNVNGVVRKFVKQ